MPISNSEEIIFQPTAEQNAEVNRVAGVSIFQIVVKGLFVKLAAAIAVHAQSQAVLLSNSSDALALMREGGIEAVKNRHFLVLLNLDSAQRQQLWDATGQSFEFVVILPDDHRAAYFEKWAEIPFPLDFGRSLTVAASGQTLAHPTSHRKVIWVEANDFTGFGTGAHPTTQLCLELIEETLQAGAQVLEVGTGSGILAMACARLGAASIVASDVDEKAVVAARNNVQLNGLDEFVRIELGTFVDEETQGELRQYDLIVGNLLPGVLRPLFPEFGRRLKRGGRLIISGVASEREQDVAFSWQQTGFVLQQRRERKDWVALVLGLADVGAN